MEFCLRAQSEFVPGVIKMQKSNDFALNRFDDGEKKKRRCLFCSVIED